MNTTEVTKQQDEFRKLTYENVRKVLEIPN